MIPKRRTIVGLSGGVDSAVSALLLQQQGYDVEGLFMKNWEDDDEPGYCAAAADLRDAQAICTTLGIHLHKVSFSAEYWNRVFSLFLEEYRAGRTPNPDVLCNKEIKFRAFLDYALALGADSIATGHYASILRAGNRWELLCSADANKDQTYFLYLLTQGQLSRSLFPIGHLEKPEVRRLAAAAGFPNHDKKDSTGICFIGERKFRDFLANYLPAKTGEILSLDNEVVGTHQGAMFYTLGQRQGLGIGGAAGRTGAAWYVVEKDVAKNILWVAQGKEHPALFHDCLKAGAIHWISGTAPSLPLRCEAKLRYRQTAQNCVVTAQSDGGAGVRFDTPQRAITPGQAVVFYQGTQCLGGGTIEKVEKTADSAALETSPDCMFQQ